MFAIAFNPCRDLIQYFPERIMSAIMEVHQKTGAPLEIVILVALSAMSTALHGVAIRTPDGRWMPISVYCMGIGPRVCGKTAAMREFYRFIRNFDSRLADRRASKDEWRNHPAFRDILQQDATWASLLEALHGWGNGLTVTDDDCYDLLKSEFMRKRGKLNRFFDGPEKESFTRRDHESLAAHYPSVGICCLTQPETYAEYLHTTRFADRKSGLAARFLYAHTLEGCSPALPNLPTPSLNEMHTLSTWLLEQRLQRLLTGNTERVELCLSSEAESRWTQIKQDIDLRMARDFSHVQDSAARATEKTWRIAALLHCFQSLPIPATLDEPLPPIAPITARAVDVAWMVVHWSLTQFYRVFPPPTPKPPKPSRVLERQREEARIAMAHIFNHLRSSGDDTIPWSLAQELSWLSPHKFKTVVAHMKSTRQVELLEGKDPILRFSSHFFAAMGYQRSVQWDMSSL